MLKYHPPHLRSRSLQVIFEINMVKFTGLPALLVGRKEILPMLRVKNRGYQCTDYIGQGALAISQRNKLQAGFIAHGRIKLKQYMVHIMKLRFGHKLQVVRLQEFCEVVTKSPLGHGIQFIHCYAPWFSAYPQEHVYGFPHAY